MINNENGFAPLGQLLIELRGKESIRTAAERIGISHTYLGTIEKGIDPRSGNERKPTPETLRLISKAYNYDYKKLLNLAGYIEDESDLNKTSVELAEKIQELKIDILHSQELYFSGVIMDDDSKTMVLNVLDKLTAALESFNELKDSLKFMKKVP